MTKGLWSDLPADGSPNLEYALCYARHGIPVFPVRPKTKTGFYCYPEYRGDPNRRYPEGNPYSWKTQASTDPERIRKLWEDHPDANICGLTGQGLYVLDLDKEHVNKDGTGKETLVTDGWERLRQWQTDTGMKLNTDTVMSITGRGGNQLFYTADRFLSGSSDIFSDSSGCDTRGEGNYILLPPSIHPNGSRYEWEQAPDEYPIAEADDTFFRYWQGSSSKKEGSSERFDPNMKVTSARHDYLKRYIGWMVHTYPDLKQSQYEDMLRKKNAEDIFPSLGDNADDLPDELERTMFPMIPKMMIKDGTRKKEQQKQADEVHAASQTEENWNSLLQTVPDRKNDLILPTMADFEEKEVDWLIHGYIPRANITILAGTGGTGKSSVWASLLASVSSGEPTILEGSYGVKRDPQPVMFFTSEDAISEVIKAKLRKNHAVMENVITLDPVDERFEKLIIGEPYLEDLIGYYKPAICLLDPLQRFISSNIRMAERNAMRHALDSLQRLGMKYGTAFIILMHTNKQSGAYSRQRIADSSDMWDIARSVLMIGETGENDSRYITHEKSNYSRLSRTVIFDIVDSVPVFKEWSDKKDRDFVLNALTLRNNNGIDFVKECSNVILSQLAESGEEGIPVQELDDLLKGMGYSDRNKRDAKQSLLNAGFIGLKREGFGGSVRMIRKRKK